MNSQPPPKKIRLGSFVRPTTKVASAAVSDSDTVVASLVAQVLPTPLARTFAPMRYYLPCKSFDGTAVKTRTLRNSETGFERVFAFVHHPPPADDTKPASVSYLGYATCPVEKEAKGGLHERAVGSVLRATEPAVVTKDGRLSPMYAMAEAKVVAAERAKPFADVATPVAPGIELYTSALHANVHALYQTGDFKIVLGSNTHEPAYDRFVVAVNATIDPKIDIKIRSVETNPQTPKMLRLLLASGGHTQTVQLWKTDAKELFGTAAPTLEQLTGAPMLLFVEAGVFRSTRQLTVVGATVFSTEHTTGDTVAVRSDALLAHLNDVFLSVSTTPAEASKKASKAPPSARNQAPLVLSEGRSVPISARIATSEDEVLFPVEPLLWCVRTNAKNDDEIDPDTRKRIRKLKEDDLVRLVTELDTALHKTSDLEAHMDALADEGLEEHELEANVPTIAVLGTLLLLTPDSLGAIGAMVRRRRRVDQSVADEGEEGEEGGEASMEAEDGEESEKIEVIDDDGEEWE